VSQHSTNHRISPLIPVQDYVQRFATKEAADAVSAKDGADDEDEVMSDVGSISDDE
jgi:ubiquitin-conjugating enzyme E2 H